MNTSPKSGSNQSHRFLSEAVRERIIKDLAGQYSGWVYGLVLIVSLYLLIEIFGKSGWHFLWALIASSIAGSIWESVKKDRLLDHDDHMLQLLHNEFQGKQIIFRVLKTIVISFVVIIVLMGYFSKQEPESKPQNNPKCVIEKVEVGPFVFVSKDEPDAGFIVNSHVKNSGPSGSITSTVRLSTSEGDFLRSSTRIIESGETQIVRIDFPEPTINATNANVQASATCEP